MATLAEDRVTPEARPAAIPKSAWFALGVLVLANVLNYLDRFIVSILAQAIKVDLKLDDAQLGFLLGTAFAVFYSIVGIAMGGIADRLPRKKVMAFGLLLWSGMTALGGAATSFTMLAIARIGVGVGEASANPCSQSLAADIFPPQRRALAMSLLLSGVFLGSAAALVIGGWFLEHWPTACAVVPIAVACSIAPWQAALFTVGLPGIPLALLVLAIREPKRVLREQGSASKFIVREFAAALPPFTVLTTYQLGGLPGVIRNLGFAALISVVSFALVLLTGDFAQWAALGLGAYAVVTWGQVQSLRDKPLFSLTFGDPTFVMGISATALVACIGGAVSTWTAPYAMRTFHLSPTEIGASLGVIHTVGAILGVVLGGVLTDRWKKRDLRAPLGMTTITLVGTVVVIPLMLFAKDIKGFLAFYFCLSIISSLWSGGIAAMTQDLVISRMRGSAAACFSLVSIVVSSGTGPYWAGKVSTVTGSLTTGMLSLLVLAPFALLLLWLTARRLPKETPEARMARAIAAGEPPPQGQ